MKIIMAEQAQQKIKKDAKGFFSVIFRRKNDKIERNSETGEKKIIAKAGDLRKMNCLLRVKKHLHTPNGEGRKYNFTEKGLISVWDRQAKDYRSFAWKKIIILSINKEKYIILSPETLDYCQHYPNTEIAKKVKNSGIEV